MNVSVRGLQPFSAIHEQALAGDASWYLNLAQHGYERIPFEASAPHNWAFFPLFPLLLKAAAFVTREWVLTGVFLSNLLFLGALFLLHNLCRLFDLTTADANRCVFYVAFFPVSYFFSVPITESLFLLLTVASFWAAKRDKWWLAGALGALASATRVTGVLLGPALALLFWQKHRTESWRHKEVLSLALIPLGLLSFMLYLHLITGNAFAFKDILVTWNRRPTFFLETLFEFVRHPNPLVIDWDVRWLNFAAATAVLVSGAVLLKRREFALACYALLSGFVALSSGLLQSQARYAMVVFPVAMVLACAGRREWVDQLARVVFVALLTLLTGMYAVRFIAALS
jgi:hypothetical protein